MAHMDYPSIWMIYPQRIQYGSERAPGLALPPRETPRRYASMANKQAVGASIRAYEAYMPMFEHP